MGSTWAVDLANVGPVYPWVGTELIMVIVAAPEVMFFLLFFGYILSGLFAYFWRYLKGPGKSQKEGAAGEEASDENGEGEGKEALDTHS